MRSKRCLKAGSYLSRAENGNGNVAMEFKDTGCGIPEEYKDRIFEQFLRQKWIGKGLDLVYLYVMIL